MYYTKSGSIEYIMPNKMAEELLKNRKGEEKNMPTQAYLQKYVNEELRLLYNCVKVTVN